MLFLDEPTVMFLYFQISASVHKLKVLNINMWGILLGNQFRKERFEALANLLNNQQPPDYDVVLLQEMWRKNDIRDLKERTKSVYPYQADSMKDAKCNSVIFEEVTQNCAGLMILSKHPFDSVTFTPYEKNGIGGIHGNFEEYVGKGVLEARLSIQDLTVDVFNTHLVSFTEDSLDIDNNGVRANQVTTLLERIKASDANVKIFGADMNAYPLKDDPNSPYSRMTAKMTDSFVERYPSEVDNPQFATYGRDGNTFTGSKPDEILDYLMHWADPSEWAMATEVFKLPQYKATNAFGQLVSITDHEPLHAEYLIIRQNDSKLSNCNMRMN